MLCRYYLQVHVHKYVCALCMDGYVIDDVYEHIANSYYLPIVFYPFTYADLVLIFYLFLLSFLHNFIVQLL